MGGFKENREMKTSVIIPNYNYANFLPLAIDSLLAQSEPIDEIIVVDDGSTDNSRAVIEGYGDKIIGIFQENQGQASAISHGFARSSGDIIFILDADDLFATNKIEVIKKIYQDNADIPWVFHELNQCDSKDVDAHDASNEAVIDVVSSMRAGVVHYCAPATSGLSFRREFIASIFPLPAAESIYISDHYIKFFCLSKSRGIHVSTKLGNQIIHDNNLYTGQKAVATRAKIFVNTAYYLKLVSPEMHLFCNSIFEEGVVCAHKSGIYEELSKLIQKYKDTMFFAEKLRLYIRLILKKILLRY